MEEFVLEKTYGMTFKHIRENKGFTKKEIAEGIVSVQFLTKFEKGESDITVERLNDLLNRIFVSWNEFMIQHSSNNLDEIPYITQQVPNLVYAKNYHELSKLNDFFEQRYRQTKFEKDLHLSLILKGIYYGILNKEVPKEEVDSVKHYLKRVDQWYYYENFLFGSIINLLETEEIMMYYSRALRNFSTSNQRILMPNLKNEFIQLLVFIGSHLIDLGEFSLANQIFTDNKSLIFIDDDPNELFYKLIYKSKHALVTILLGNIEQGKAEMKRIMDALELIGEYPMTINSIYLDMERGIAFAEGRTQTY